MIYNNIHRPSLSLSPSLSNILCLSFSLPWFQSRHNPLHSILFLSLHFFIASHFFLSLWSPSPRFLLHLPLTRSLSWAQCFSALSERSANLSFRNSHTNRGQDTGTNLIYRSTGRDFLEQHVHVRIRPNHLPLRFLSDVIRTAGARIITSLHRHFPCSLGFKKTQYFYCDRRLTYALLVVTPAAVSFKPVCNSQMSF